MAYRFDSDSRFLVPSEEELPDVLLVGKHPTGGPRKVSVASIPGIVPSPVTPLYGDIGSYPYSVTVDGGYHKFKDGQYYAPEPGDYSIDTPPPANNTNVFLYGGLISGEYAVRQGYGGFDGDAYNLLPCIMRMDSSGAALCTGSFAKNRFIFDATLLRSGTASEYKNTYSLSAGTYHQAILPAPWPEEVMSAVVWHYGSIVSCISCQNSPAYPRGFEQDSANRHIIFLNDAFIGSTRTWWLVFITGTTSVQVAILSMDFENI